MQLTCISRSSKSLYVLLGVSRTLSAVHINLLQVRSGSKRDGQRGHLREVNAEESLKSTEAVRDRPLFPFENSLFIVNRTQPPEGEGSQSQTQVAKCHVEISRDHQQIDNYQDEPRRDDIGKVFRL